MRLGPFYRCGGTGGRRSAVAQHSPQQGKNILCGIEHIPAPARHRRRRTAQYSTAQHSTAHSRVTAGARIFCVVLSIF
jgi:hypothetical protein